MKNVKNVLYICMLFHWLIFEGQGVAWDNETTHRDITSYAADNSLLNNYGNYLAAIGISEGLGQKFKWNTEKTVKEWLQEGAYLEDNTLAG